MLLLTIEKRKVAWTRRKDKAINAPKTEDLRPVTKDDVKVILERFDELEARLSDLTRIEGRLNQLQYLEEGDRNYTVKRAAEITGLSEFSIRQACNLGRIDASKVRERWMISRETVERLRQSGLPPLKGWHRPAIQ